MQKGEKLYTSAVLVHESVDLLRLLTIDSIDAIQSRGFKFKTANGYLPHHMTINMGKIEAGPLNRSNINSFVKLEVSQIVLDEKLGVCAAIVDNAYYQELSTEWKPLKSMNLHPHITIALKEGVKPVSSNEMLSSSCYQVFILDKRYTLNAVVDEN